jgi:uncharacterized membrane protein affecting hemolysin expression
MSLSPSAYADSGDSRQNIKLNLSLNVTPLGIRHIDDAIAQKVVLTQVAVGHYRLTFDTAITSDREINLISAVVIPATLGQAITAHQLQLTNTTWRNVMEVQCYVAGVLTAPARLNLELALYNIATV